MTSLAVNKTWWGSGLQGQLECGVTRGLRTKGLTAKKTAELPGSGRASVVYRKAALASARVSGRRSQDS